VAELNYRNQNRTARIDFISKEKNPKRLLEAENISKSYDSKILFKNLSLLLSPGSRIGLHWRDPFLRQRHHPQTSPNLQLPRISTIPSGAARRHADRIPQRR
jgi:hypothetical protein